METTDTITKHKHFELCYRAHCNTSFSPDRRAEMYCSAFDEKERELKSLGLEDYVLHKHERLFVAWMHAKGNCISSMITGPSNFPIARAEKANRREEAHGKAYYDYLDKITRKVKRDKYYEENPEKRPIKSDDQDAIERLSDKINKLKNKQEIMKAANRAIRKKDKAAVMEITKLSESMVEKLFEPDWCGRVGFPDYELTNNLANIKRLEGRLKQLETIEKTETKEEVENGIKFVVDTQINRIYIEFDGKPNLDTRNLLKSNGFKWTPSKGHWGRVLTKNAEYALEIVRSRIGDTVAV